MTAKTYRAWIIAPTGRNTRFRVAMESILMPNHFDVSQKSWADKRGARKALERGGYGVFQIVDAEPFDLIRVDQAARDAYHLRSQNRRNAIMAWSETPMAKRMLADANEEEELNLHILGAKMGRIVATAIELRR